MGHTPDGAFKFVESTIQILSAPRRSVDELNKRAKIIRDAREQKAASEAVVDKTRKELPELAGLADLLPQTRGELNGLPRWAGKPWRNPFLLLGKL